MASSGCPVMSLNHVSHLQIHLAQRLHVMDKNGNH